MDPCPQPWDQQLPPHPPDRTPPLTATLTIVEDDPRLGDLLEELFVFEGYAVRRAASVRQARASLHAEVPDLVILDLGLPDGDGLDLLAEIRLEYQLPVIILTARGDLEDELQGLRLGADDYVAKPVHPDRIVARVAAVLRRTGVGDRLELGDLVVDLARREVRVGTHAVALTTAEFDLVCFLAQRAGRTVSRDELSRALIGSPYDGTDRTLDLRVSRVRSLLGDDARAPRFIKTVRGRGYQLVRP